MATPAASRALLSAPMKWAVGGWTFFIAENFILSENRTWLISEFGGDAYHAAYGTLSTAAMGSVFYGYFRKVRNTEPLLWSLAAPAPLGARVLGFACLSLGLGMASQIPPKVQIPVHFVSGGENDNKLATSPLASEPVAAAPTATQEEGGWKVRCPFDFTDNKDANGPVHGLERITRHPGLWAFGLLGLGNAFLVPSLPQRLWLAMPSMVALAGGAHTDSRFRRGMGGTLTEEYDAATSNVPFLAMLTGAQGNVGDALRDFAEEVKPLNALVAVGVSGLWVLRRGRGVKMPPLR
ncbi:hypothetical protein ACHAXT_005366 [Thalassiosira profunda]